MTGEGRHTIGQVVRELSGDFPDLTISKVRFLEGKGLITPERTASGYRLFSDDQVERLRFILTSQRDRFWPLKVIAAALEHGMEPMPGFATPSEAFAALAAGARYLKAFPAHEAAPRLSARFSLMDLPDFLDMPCRGDLSLIGAPS